MLTVQLVGIDHKVVPDLFNGQFTGTPIVNMGKTTGKLGFSINFPVKQSSDKMVGWFGWLVRSVGPLPVQTVGDVHTPYHVIMLVGELFFEIYMYIYICLMV